MTSRPLTTMIETRRIRALAAAWLFLLAQIFVVAHEAEAGPDHAALDCDVCISAQRDDTAVAADPPSVPVPSSHVERRGPTAVQPLCSAATATAYSVRAPPLV